jgi:predicted AlkP superfamily pyrophosphatase or phosphodiesterase
MARRAVIVILDGLRRDFLSDALTPTLQALAAEAESFAHHRSVFPSTTRVSAASIATGCRPARHGLQGNAVALREDGRLTRRDVGKPDFFEAMRRTTGRTLRVATLAEQLARRGEGCVAYSNVSPGAAYALDPDGHGFVYHRAGSFAPGRQRVADAAAACLTADAAGDRAMTERMCGELESRRPAPAASILWLCEPDKTQHGLPLGSAPHLAALRAADGCVARVLETCARLTARTGDDLLLVVGSDHGHRTIRRAINIDQALVDAGLKAAPESHEVVVAANGTAALVYLADDARERQAAIGKFLRAQDWVGAVLEGAALAEAGLDPDDGTGLALAIDMRAYDAVNQHGVAGLSDGAVSGDEDPYWLGNGNHGGLARYEQDPFLMIRGAGFAAGAVRRTPTSLVDIAPTVLAHLGLPAGRMDGRALQSR